MTIRTMILAALLIFTVASLPVLAVEPSEVLDDPVLEERARDISAGLRCLVCQNQSIDDSNAQLAKDLRILVRDRLVAGDSNDEVIDYVVSRYGDFVLLKPPMKMSTYALWYGPVLIVILGIIAYVAVFRRRTSATATPCAPSTPVTTQLSAEEEERLAALLDEKDETPGKSGGAS